MVRSYVLYPDIIQTRLTWLLNLQWLYNNAISLLQFPCLQDAYSGPLIRDGANTSFFPGFRIGLLSLFFFSQQLSMLLFACWVLLSMLGQDPIYFIISFAKFIWCRAYCDHCWFLMSASRITQLLWTMTNHRLWMFCMYPSHDMPLGIHTSLMEFIECRVCRFHDIICNLLFWLQL